MAAGNWTVYSHGVLNVSNAAENLGSDAFSIILLTNSYTPLPNTDALYSDISANEVASGSGYTAKGILLTGVTNTLATATVTFTSSNAAWASFSAVLRYAAIIHNASGTQGGLTGTDKLLAYCDLTGGGSITGGGGTFTISMGSTIFTITHSP